MERFGIDAKTIWLVHDSGRNVIVDKAYYDESGFLHFVGAYEDDPCGLAFDFPIGIAISKR